MNKTVRAVTAALISILLCFIFGSILFRYTIPMEDKVYDLSLIWYGEAMPENWKYDQKGWDVFTQDGEKVTSLTADGFGGFYGDFQKGQTVYYSRTLSEKMDSPVLRIDSYNWSVAVFLDEEMIYSDSPELDNRIGALTLPMLEWERNSAVIVELPDNYLGKTLTIAQSTNPLSEFDSVILCPVMLYCGFSYESGLIAESFGAAVPAALFFAAGVLALIIFIFQPNGNHTDISALGAAMVSFLWMSRILTQTSFFAIYQSERYSNLEEHLSLWILAVLLVVMAGRAGRFRFVAWMICTMYMLSCIVCFIIDMHSRVISDGIQSFFRKDMPAWIGVSGMVVILALAWSFWRRERRFYQIFAPLASVGSVFIFVVGLLRNPSELMGQLYRVVTDINLSYLLQMLTLAFSLATLVSLLWEMVERVGERRIESRLIAEQVETAVAGYKNLQEHQEEIMMLRHDMLKHLHLLQQMTTENAVVDYIRELIGQNERIYPVIQSGNQMFDILLGSRIARAKEQNIDVEILRAKVPDKLPLTDAELCSLVTNLMDNALEAAAASGAPQPFIRLDMYVKNNFFVFLCENSAACQEKTGKKVSEGVAEHGLGLKIVKKILQQYDELYEAEYTDGCYRVMIALLLAKKGGEETGTEG